MRATHNTPAVNDTPVFYLPILDRKIFCAFHVVYNAAKGKYDKFPHDATGKKGIAAKDQHRLADSMTVENFLLADGRQAYTSTPDQPGWYMGLSFYQPIIMDGQHLVCVDIDIEDGVDEQSTKYLDRFIHNMKEGGHYYERSVSGRGYHFFVLCDEHQIPKTYDSKSGWKIEVFSGIGSAIKLICLSNQDIGGKLQSANLMNEFMRYGFRSDLATNPQTGLTAAYQAPGSVVDVESTPVVEIVKTDLNDPTLNIPSWTKESIKKGCSTSADGEVNNDRSAVIYGVIKDLIKCRLSDGQIVSLLTNQEYGLAEKALEKGSLKAARDWVAKQIPKHRQEVMVELEATHKRGAEDFGEVMEVVDSETGEVVSASIHCPMEAYPFLVASENLFSLPRQKRTEKYVADQINLYKAVSMMPIRFDEFVGANIYRNSKGEWVKFYDGIYYHIAIALQAMNFASPPSEILRECVRAVCGTNRVDTARDWANNLVWDKQERCKHLFSEYFGVQQSELSDAASMYLASAMGARVLNSPSEVVDMVVTLIGKQGTGKSRAVKALAPQVDQYMEVDFSQKEDDISRKSLGKLVAEFSELQGLKSKSAEHMKSWMSRATDEWVQKFREETFRSNRRFVVIATTNEDQFLTDTTGNRRWIVLHTDGESSADRLRSDNNQLWAEAVHIFKTDGLLKHYMRVKELAGQENHKYISVGEVEIEDVKEFLTNRRTMAYSNKGGSNPNEPFRLRDVIKGIYPERFMDKRLEHSVARCLISLGYKRRHTRTGKVWVHHSE